MLIYTCVIPGCVKFRVLGSYMPFPASPESEGLGTAFPLPTMNSSSRVVGGWVSVHLMMINIIELGSLWNLWM